MKVPLLVTVCPQRAAKNAPFVIGYGVVYGCHQCGSDQYKHLHPHMDSWLQCCRHPEPLILRRTQLQSAGTCFSPLSIQPASELSLVRISTVLLGLGDKKEKKKQ
ncbi:hypothetical protein M378DRAFT_173809 [Amanita muscaria Koide BX008]|uniref:Uncharacterized protein n=1 Tax=Amanita muscaria (strain Koide BX008) TaxID=946122 RepID=A0A0C2WGI0_AMAMK|nr:hypothetical protein M378DRAFT_173809 [Amanita muscaria Koide BX008]